MKGADDPCKHQAALFYQLVAEVMKWRRFLVL